MTCSKSLRFEDENPSSIFLLFKLIKLKNDDDFGSLEMFVGSEIHSRSKAKNEI